MGRPAGSKNKPKAEEVETVKFTTKSDVLPAVKAEPQTEWKPAPDMGKIVPPAQAEKVCANCPHKREMHYGGAKGWCNVGGCNCQEFK